MLFFLHIFAPHTCSVYFSCRSLIKLYLIRVQLRSAWRDWGGNLPKPRYIPRTSPNTSRPKIKGLDEALALQPVWGANTCAQPWQGREGAVFYVGDVQTSPSSPSANLSFVTRRRFWSSAAARLIYRRINHMWGSLLIGTVLNYPAGNPNTEGFFFFSLTRGEYLYYLCFFFEWCSSLAFLFSFKSRLFQTALH